MIIPFDQLEPGTLQNIIEEFINREGTDYGEVEVGLDTKVKQVLSQIKSGRVVILFDESSESVTLMNREEIPPEYMDC